MDAEVKKALVEKINQYDWFHEIDFGNGIVTPGHCTGSILKAKAECYFSISPKGRTVLDIGCWDGFFSVEALRRGAARVLSTDYYVWHTKWSRGAFDLVREHLAPQLEVKEIDVYDISPDTVGTFDFVLLTGVLYHTRHPLLALEKTASVCNDVLVVETVLDTMSLNFPAMAFYPGSELKQDPSNWWGANRLCVEAMLRDVGFKGIRYTQTPIPRRWTIFDWVKHNPAIPPRGVFHARR